MSHVDPNPQDAADLEAMAAKLEATGTYRVLRKLASRSLREPPPGVATRQGLFVDTETTGLDPARDEIIELAMVPFTYSLDGQIYAVGEPFQQLREPAKPIPPEITAITGIDDAMVTGQRIDPDEVAHFAAPASLVVAHNAAFDRKFLERFCETFNTNPWAWPGWRSQIQSLVSSSISTISGAASSTGAARRPATLAPARSSCRIAARPMARRSPCWRRLPIPSRAPAIEPSKSPRPSRSSSAWTT